MKRFDGWGVHDCDRTEAAGVRCKKPPPPATTTTTTTPRPKIPVRHRAKNVEVRLMGGRVEYEGRVEVNIDNEGWGVVCGDGWGTRLVLMLILLMSFYILWAMKQKHITISSIFT